MSTNRRDVRGRISGKKRTSCCVTGLRNLGPLARVSLVQHEGGVEERKEAEEQEDASDDEIDNNERVNKTDVVIGGGLFGCVAGCGADNDYDYHDSGNDSDSDTSYHSNGYEPELPKRPPRKFLPSQRQAMALLSMAMPPEDRGGFRERFCAASMATEENKSSRTGCGVVCNTPVPWIASAYGCDNLYRLRHAADKLFRGRQVLRYGCNS